MPVIIHPHPDEQGHPVPIFSPHEPTPPEAWKEAGRIATVVPGGPMPPALNGLAVASWQGGDWVALAARAGLPELPWPAGRAVASGAVVVEPDGRVWLVAPTNGYSGYQATFPKGRVDAGLTLQACALKETFEETGLKVELVDHLLDVPRAKGFARYYFARRRGGNPADMGWESQAVHLVPQDQLAGLLNRPRDQAIALALKIRWDSLRP